MTPGRKAKAAWILLAFLATLASAGSSTAAGDDPAVPGLSRGETLRLGERMYRDGILPSGEPLTATLYGGIHIEGTMFSCVSCHLRSGLGSFEGGVLTPPTNGVVLYKPWNSSREDSRLWKGNLEGAGGLRTRSMYYVWMGSMEMMAAQRNAPLYNLYRFGKYPGRPAYTDETVADAIRGGANPDGREFIGVMPRYTFDDRDLAILIAYLKSLSKDLSPGVTETTIRFATVVTEEVNRKERDALLASLERYFLSHNARLLQQEAIHADPDFRRISLVLWELKGPPETWRGQLEEYYRKDPVFALLGGISTKEWRPIHEFCEENAIPCLLPITDLPVVSATSWYTLYFSKGFYQEGETAARHLARTEDSDPGRTVVQVYPDTPEGKAFAFGFRDAWSETGRGPLVEKVIPAGGAVTRGYLEEAIGGQRRAVLVLWTGAEAFPALEAMGGGDGGGTTVYLSGTLLKDRLLSVPEALRERTYITYPYRLTDSALGTGVGETSPEITDRRIGGKVGSLIAVLNEVFGAWRSNFYRDYMYDIIDTSMLVVYSPFERISFGPGQRYASKGCYIVRLSKGAKPELVGKTDWVVY